MIAQELKEAVEVQERAKQELRTAQQQEAVEQKAQTFIESSANLRGKMATAEEALIRQKFGSPPGPPDPPQNPDDRPVA